jgi:tripartite-type tricarboxylate transporter receptor subunit TctC
MKTYPTQGPKRRDVLRVAAASTVAYASFGGAQTSGWPSKPVTMVVPFAPGGGTDAFARPLSAQFGKQTGKTLIIENRGGAGGTVGASIAAKAPNDGYSIFMGAVHHTIAPSMYPRLDYNIETDFVPLLLAANVPQVVVVNPKNMPVANFKEYLALLRKNPGKYNYGSAGAGTSHHLAGELFKQQTKTFITHIPYTGSGPALRDLVGGQVDMMFDGLGSSAVHLKAGRIKGMMVASPKRNPAFPDIPSSVEVGMPDYNVTTWYGLWAPKGTPPDLCARITEEMRKALSADELKPIWAQNGADFPLSMTSPQFGAFVSAEVKRWAAVVKSSGAKLE